MAKLDRKGKRAKWTKARVAEQSYNSRLKQVASQIGQIVKGLAPDGSLKDVGSLLQALKDYAKLIEPWARSVAALMVADVVRRDQVMWTKIGKELSSGIRQELNKAPTGLIFNQLQEEQVVLIKSLPLEAAERIQGLAQEATLGSIRPADIAKKIMETESVSKAKATLIARTEVSRSASNLVQARSTYAGSEGYIWRTSGDLDVRDTHKEMEGVYVRWDTPPKTDKSLAPYHAGAGPNCRCFAEPIFPDD